MQAPVPGSGEQWRGTVFFEEAHDAHGTEMFGMDTGNGPSLVHNGKTVGMSTFPFTVGRMDCNYLMDNPKVSRHHITLRRDNGQLTVQDENSSNHTYINGSMIPPFTPYALRDGDELRLGNERLIVKVGNE